jgi:glyoxalase family protein
MTPTLPGIHHVTAITADAQANVDFYCGVLGLRLVKLTVNFDDPQSYHLYYGDAAGSPGSIMTFFAWPGGRKGPSGTGQVTATAFAVPAASLPYWSQRLQDQGVRVDTIDSRFDDTVLSFEDPDGMRLELVPSAAAVQEGADSGPIPREHAIAGFHSVTLSVEGYEHTAQLLTTVMSFTPDGAEGNRFRYRAAGGTFAALVDVLCTPDARRGGMGAGAVHHVAFRTPDDGQQAAWRSLLVQAGFNTSPVMDRSYFHSIYFREPGGVLFEIATDIPGFAVDEAPASLGTGLMLPPQYETHRDRITELLPPLRLPHWSDQ